MKHNLFKKSMDVQSQSQRGQAMLVAVLFFIAISVTIIIGLAVPVMGQLKVSEDLLKSKQSLYWAEGQLDDAIYRFMNGMQVDEAGETVDFNGNQVVLSFEDSFNGKKILAEGEWLGSFRKIETEIIEGEGAAFNYGVQAGNEGFLISGNSTIDGNVYSNGDILGDGGSTITESATAVHTIEGLGGSQWWQPLNVEGDSWANTVTQTKTDGVIYCQSSINNYPPPGGTPCDTSRPDPETAEFPITDDHVDAWKQEAEAGDTIEGDVNVGWAGAEIGPAKIEGDLTLGGGGVLTVTGTIWVEGSIVSGGGASIVLDESYGNDSGVIIADDVVDLTGNTQFFGSGQEGSYPILVTTSQCPDAPGCGGDRALSISGGSGAVVLIAQNGTLSLVGGSAARSLIGYKIEVSGGGTIEYDAGLVNMSFSSGPSGGFQVLSWKEVE